MRVYLAGPMHGYPEWNFPAFHSAADRLRGLGHRVIDPAALDEVYDCDLSPEGVATACKSREYIRRDVEAICISDAIVMLDGWQESLGARGELAVAKWAGLNVFYSLDDFIK